MKKILMIEDDTDLQEGLSFSLKLGHYETTCVSTCRLVQHCVINSEFCTRYLRQMCVYKPTA